MNLRRFVLSCLFIDLVMCTSQRLITNPYTHKKMYAKCGHCPSCLTEKAIHRVQRIKAQDSVGFKCYMLSLTYARHNAPYFKRSEAYAFTHGELDKLNIYRDVKYRYVRVGSSYDTAISACRSTHILCTLDDSFDLPSIKGVKDLKHEFDKVGVCFYPDLQRFFARLRLNLKRHYSYEVPFHSYQCSEYGTKSLRPHFHVLIWIPATAEKIFRAAINESWPFSNILYFPRSFEAAVKCATYVSSYVNLGSDFPEFLKCTFRPKHSYSKGFGVGVERYKLPSVLSKFYGGHLTYFAQKNRFGFPQIVECVLPKYVIHRYFPLVKGYSRFVGIAQLEYLHGFTSMYPDEFCKKYGFLDRNSRISYLHGRYVYDPVEIAAIGTRLMNAWKRYNELSGDPLDYYNYLRLHQSIWNLWKSDSYRVYMQNDEIPLNEKYDNLAEVKDSNFFPVGFTADMLKVTNPNQFPHNIRVTNQYECDFHNLIKHRSVANVIYSQATEEF